MSPPTIFAPDEEPHELAQLKEYKVENVKRKVHIPDSSEDDGDEQGDPEHR